MDIVWFSAGFFVGLTAATIVAVGTYIWEWWKERRAEARATKIESCDDCGAPLDKDGNAITLKCPQCGADVELPMKQGAYRLRCTCDCLFTIEVK